MSVEIASKVFVPFFSSHAPPLRELLPEASVFPMVMVQAPEPPAMAVHAAVESDVSDGEPRDVYVSDVQPAPEPVGVVHAETAASDDAKMMMRSPLVRLPMTIVVVFGLEP